MASKQEVIGLDMERKSRRERLANKLSSTCDKLAPSRLTANITDERKAKVREAGRKAGDFTKEHKYAIGGGVAALAASAAGLLFWRRKAKAKTDQAAPSNSQVDAALADARPITEAQGAPAGGAAV